MKFRQRPETLERIGEVSETNFTIRSSAHAFKILSSNLYQDKIGAIVREISTNAYDAHILKGNQNRPFEVFLPSLVSPVFRVRDFGPGLSRNDMLTIYQSYFLSTKNTSNEYIGGLGLGGKSPFSYVSSFTIISRFDNERTTYTLAINAQGMPTIAVQHTAPFEDGEETGLEVIVPVSSQKDFNTFSSKVQNAYRHYPVKPLVNGAQIDDANETPVFEGQGYKIFDHFVSNGPRGIFAIMGVNAYPINLSNIDFAHMSACSAYVYFDVGELDVTAGREDLSYDPETIRVIKERLSVIYEEVRSNIQQMFDNAKTLREAKITLKKYHAESYYSWVRQFKIVPKYNGEDLAIRYCLDLKLIAGVAIRYADRVVSYTEKDTPTTPRSAFGYEIYLQPEEDFVKVYYADASDRLRSRVEHDIQSNSIKNSLVIYSIDPKVISIVEKSLDQKATPVSSLPFPPKIVRQSTKKKLKVRQLTKPNPLASMDNKWREVTIEIDDREKLYVITDHKKIIDPKGYDDPTFFFVWNFLHQLGFSDEVYSVPKSLSHTLKTGGWVDFWDRARDLIQDEITQHPELLAAIQSSDIVKSLNDDRQYRSLFFAISGIEVSEKHMINKVSKHVKAVQNFTNLYSTFCEKLIRNGYTVVDVLTHLRGVLGIAKNSKVEVTNTLKLVSEKYPLIRSFNTSQNAVKDISLYIAAMDAYKRRMA